MKQTSLSSLLKLTLACIYLDKKKPFNDLYQHRLTLPLLKFHLKGITLCARMFLLSGVMLWFIHVIAYVYALLLCIAEECSLHECRLDLSFTLLGIFFPLGFWLLWRKQLLAFMCISFYVHIFSYLMGISLKEKLLVLKICMCWMLNISRHFQILFFLEKCFCFWVYILIPDSFQMDFYKCY